MGGVHADQANVVLEIRAGTKRLDVAQQFVEQLSGGKLDSVPNGGQQPFLAVFLLIWVYSSLLAP